MTSSPSTTPSTALNAEIVISWWKDWQSFLRLHLDMNVLRARMVSIDAFDLDQDDGTKREREISERLNAIPSTRRAVFERALETQRGRLRTLREPEQGAAGLDQHEIERAAISTLLDIAEGDREKGRPAAVPTERDIWYDVDPSVVEQVPDADTYAITKARGGPSKAVLSLLVILGVWAGIGAIYYATRPHGAANVAAAPGALINGGPLQPWPVRLVRLSSRELPVSLVSPDVWPHVEAGRAGWKAGTVLPMELCVPKVEAGALPTTLTLLGASSHMDRVVTLSQQPPRNPMLRLVTCGGDAALLAYGTLAATIPQAAVAVGETWALPGVGDVTVTDVRAIGPGQDTTIPLGRVQVQVSLNAPADVDWPSYTPILTLFDGTAVRSSEIRPSAVGGALAAVYDVAADELQGPTAVIWEMHDVSPMSGAYRWHATITPPRSRLEELTASTRLAITEAAWEGGRLNLTLQITNVGTTPLIISAGDIAVTQDEAPITVPPFSQGSYLVAPGASRTFSLGLFASAAQPVTLYLGATGALISPPAP